MFDAIIFFDVFGCQWRMLPAERPKRQTVHYYFRRRGAKDASYKNFSTDVFGGFKTFSCEFS